MVGKRVQPRGKFSVPVTAVVIAITLLATCVMSYMKPAQQITSKLEDPGIAVVVITDQLLAPPPQQISVRQEDPSVPEYTVMEILYALTTEGAGTIPSEYMPARVPRYINIHISGYELWELAAAIQLEAGNQNAEGQQAVAEAILNRVLHEGFPDTVHDVIHDDGGIGVPQFSVTSYLETAEPTQAQYDAIYAALFGDSIIPTNVVFFSRNGENDRVWGKIGDHVFCYEYEWEEKTDAE